MKMKSNLWPVDETEVSLICIINGLKFYKSVLLKLDLYNSLLTLLEYCHEISFLVIGTKQEFCCWLLNKIDIWQKTYFFQSQDIGKLGNFRVYRLGNCYGHIR